MSNKKRAGSAERHRLKALKRRARMGRHDNNARRGREEESIRGRRLPNQGGGEEGDCLSAACLPLDCSSSAGTVSSESAVSATSGDGVRRYRSPYSFGGLTSCSAEEVKLPYHLAGVSMDYFSLLTVRPLALPLLMDA
jgi:hypothetical protein